MGQTLVRATAGILAVTLTGAAGVIAGQDGGWIAALAAVAASITFARRPEDAVLVAAAFVPLGAALPIVTGLKLGWTELVVYATTAGWLWRRAWATAPAPTPEATFSTWALAFGVAACASGLAVWWGEEWSAIPEPRPLVQWAEALASEFDHSPSPLRGALRLAGGAALAACIGGMAGATAAARGTRMLLAAVCAVGVLSLYRVTEIALRSPAPVDRLIEVIGALRIAPVIGDPNALGALFLLLTPVALGLSFSREGRLAASTALAVLVAGAWLAGSRTTLAVTPLAAAIVVLLRTGMRRIPLWRWWAAAAALGALAVALVALPSGRHVSASTAWTIRRDFGVVTARMIREDPLFGVGQNRFYRRSSEYMPTSLRRYYARENAHNQYFQVVGELGLLGAIPFLAMVCLIAGRARATDGRRDEAPAVAAGVLAFLVVSAAQHPLFDLNVGGAFWIASGLLLAFTKSEAPRPQPRLLAVLPWVVILVTVALLPVQVAHRAANDKRAGVVTGQGLRHAKDESGAFWTTSRRLTLYVPADARRCELRMRARGIPGEAEVTLAFDHRPAGAVLVERGAWRAHTVTVPAHRVWPLAHHRLDLEWNRPPERSAVLDLADAVCH